MTDASRRRLGRGLESLLGPSVAEARADGSLATLPMGAIRPNPYQPRNVFDETALEELKESLRTSGLLQPIIVRPSGEGYELIAGERRWRAAERLGWKEIGAVVREVDDRTLLTLALVENLQRDALSPIDEARGYQRLIVEFTVSQNELGGMVGRDRSTVANALRLLKLPEDVQELVHSEALSTGHARALLQLKEGEEMSRLARQAVDQGLSVRELEALVRGDRAPQRRARGGKEAKTQPQGTDVRRVEDVLRRRLKTDVFVTPRGKGGRVSITFYSNDDLARLLHIILGEPYGG
jgi:ParB family transcriptional regulator, chromosome partitioning protein